MIDCYVLTEKRSSILAENFIDHFMPNREASFSPEDPSDVLGVSPSLSLPDIFQFLQDHTDLEYLMYWHNKDHQPPFHSMVSFN